MKYEQYRSLIAHWANGYWW